MQPTPNKFFADPTNNSFRPPQNMPIPMGGGFPPMGPPMGAPMFRPPF